MEFATSVLIVRNYQLSVNGQSFERMNHVCLVFASLPVLLEMHNITSRLRLTLSRSITHEPQIPHLPFVAILNPAVGNR